MSTTPNTTTTSITATDNPSTTTAFLLGQLVAKVDALNAKVDSVTQSFTKEIDDLKAFRLKMYLIVGAISATMNIPGWMALFK